MPRRKHTFAVGEYYHCYNRGTDKRVIFNDKQDYNYFIKSVVAYNSFETLGKLRLQQNVLSEQQLVEVVSYCLLPNHYHMVLKEKTEGGISKYIQRISIGYTMYYNEKHKRSGALFQGSFKSKFIETDQDLKQVISYVTYNNVVHNISNDELFRSKLNLQAEIVRDPISNFPSESQMMEVVNIIKEQRLSFDNTNQ